MNTTQVAVSASLSETELIFANVTQIVDSMLKDNESNEEILAYLTETNQFYRNNRSVRP